MFYIVNAKGEVVASASGPVDVEPLAAKALRVIQSDLDLRIDAVTTTGSPGELRIVARPKEILALLVLSTNAAGKDRDDIPELKADGRSVATITAVTQSPAGERIEDEIEITFRTTAGRLSVRTVTTAKGKASVRLTSTRETILTHVTATAPGFEPAHLDFEFVP